MQGLTTPTSALLSIPHSVRVGVLKRIGARVIDGLVMLLLASALPSPFGALCGFLYSILGDGLNFGPFRYQSIGKKALGLRVRRVQPGDGAPRPPMHLQNVALRNLPVGVATFFQIIPVMGWILLVLVGVPLMAFEIWLMIRIPGSHRLGDVLGDTEVVSADA